MSTLFSPSTSGFYDSRVNIAIPQDAIAISDQEHSALMEAQATGKQIVAGSGGNPVAVTPTIQPLTLAQAIAYIISAASDTANSIVKQVYPDPTHQAAFQNAAMILSGNGGNAPTAEPLASKFAALAALYLPKDAPLSGFATFIVTMQGASLDLSAALTILTAAAGAATAQGDLQAALTAFESTVTGIVQGLNSIGLPIAIEAPASISMPAVAS